MLDTRIILSSTWVVVTLIHLYDDVLRINSGDLAKSMANKNFNQFVWPGNRHLDAHSNFDGLPEPGIAQSMSRRANIIAAVFFLLFNHVGLPLIPRSTTNFY